jgi:Fe-S-cluster-containing hydrogenase component 2
VNGEVVIHDGIGCGRCVDNCPCGVIQLVHDTLDDRWFRGDGSRRNRRWNRASAGGEIRLVRPPPAGRRACAPVKRRCNARESDEMMRVADHRDAPVPARKTSSAMPVIAGCGS